MYRNLNQKSRARDRHLQKKYELSEDDYQIMFDNQRGRCAICEKSYCFSKKNLNVDHDHFSNKVRGLLCNRCNLGLGQFKDNPFLLEKAAAYIKSYRRQDHNPI